MSVNFHNDMGLMVSVDIHKYTPLPPVWPHVVMAFFFWPPSLWTKRVSSVTSMTNKMTKGGLDLYLVPHIPFLGPAPGAAAFWPELGKIIISSGTKAQLAVHSVTGEKDKLACCISGMVGANVNCNDPIDLPNGLTLQFNTVVTQPTPGDYVGALVGYAVDAAISFGVGKALEKVGSDLAEVIVKHLLRRAPEILGEWADPAGKLGDAVQKAIDGEK
ncbi:hypothetical protein [Chondromyces apiculatus]|uniref:Uncharacterized protein n=1 Tax=Chondromyces apiculatus DSM 436 TaxID=1192034 RepID=A0A017SYN3_9BACT|nr:hypothetical protein [Chondromyces apiculatus]EYF02069.1 Hypothetical protein CAP_7548 [Chondromyces apiculatus DSM 436]